ncbi:hypothetical protein Ocin01_16893 [Orchesella cincta]|uniref:Uncharacterized protein n=1 Tax=Orchesella cincta TaxID=48709 RepID=A0A1D2MA22_ORCCI|nr:hypothetical protein Ocin01_16893 [Orchesella cincta]
MTVYEKPTDCLNECEKLPNSPFPIDTCLNCVSFPNPFCQYNTTEQEGICERRNFSADEVQIVSRDFPPFDKYLSRVEPRVSITKERTNHVTKNDCYSDCDIFINNKDPFDDCVSCTRTNPSYECFYVHQSHQCYSREKAEVSGLEYKKDYFKTNNECAKDCSYRSKNGTNPKQHCLQCTQNHECVFLPHNDMDLSFGGKCVPKDSPEYCRPDPFFQPCLPFRSGFTNDEECLNIFACQLSYQKHATPLKNCLGCTEFNVPGRDCAFMFPNSFCAFRQSGFFDKLKEGKDFAAKPGHCTSVCKQANT